MKYALFLVLLLTVCLTGSEVTVDTPSATDGNTLSAQEFLTEIRKPLRVDAWAEFTGNITYKSGDKSLKGKLRVRITFDPSSMHTQITVDDRNVYLLEQTHVEGQHVQGKIERPENEISPGLFEFGILPEDLTFSFLYWDFLEELPRQTSRLRECRVMRLADPNGQGTVSVWFNAKHGFPMEAWWYAKDSTTPWRKLSLKGAHRYANGLWFVKEMRLEGKDWKTRVLFDHADLNPVGE